MIKKYLQIIKPSIIIANLFSVLFGFFFYSDYYVNWNLLFFVLLATGLMIGSGCIFNNIIDIDIDQKMHRTKNRVLVKNDLNIFFVKIYGIFLFLISIIIFLYKVNILSCILSVFGFFCYVILYSLYIKRISIYSTIIGGFSGAIPPVIGYCSISNKINLEVIILFLIFYIWQIPHFYSLLIIYQKDYFLANIPTIIKKKGMVKTIQEIIFYVIIFFLLTILLYIQHDIHMINIIILSLLNIFWLCISFLLLVFIHNIFYAKLLFYYSIITIFIFNLLSIFNYYFF